MTESTVLAGNGTKSKFIESLGSYAQTHKARHWKGTFGEFLEEILPQDPTGICRNSHQYIWDMLRWKAGRSANGKRDSAISLFSSELYGVDDALERIANYFKAASAGSEVGRRLLLLLGPPSGGKSPMIGCRRPSHVRLQVLTSSEGTLPHSTSTTPAVIKSHRLPPACP